MNDPVKSRKFMYWLPRILAVVFICFITIFSFDVFDSAEPWWRQLAGFIIHSIPSTLYTGALVWAWKDGRRGGLAFMVLAVLTVLRFGFDNAFVVYLMVPVLLTIGALFYFQVKPRPIGPGQPPKG